MDGGSAVQARRRRWTSRLEKRISPAGRVLFMVLLLVVTAILLPGTLGCANPNRNQTATRSEAVPTRIILVKTKEQAMDILHKLEQGASFALLARQYSIHATAEKYGYLGEMRPWDLNPLYQKAIGPLEPGEHSGVIDTPEGFALLSVVDRRHLTEGLSRFADKDFRKAALELEQDIQLNPDHDRAYHYLGLAYEELGQEEKSLSTFKALVQLSPSYPAAQSNLGLAYYHSGRYEEAIGAFTEALAQAPGDAVVMNNLAWCLIKIDRSLDIALKLMRRAVLLQPNEPEYRDTLAEVLLAQGQPAEALAEVQKAIELSGPSERLAERKRRIEAQVAQAAGSPKPRIEGGKPPRRESPASLLPPLPPPSAKIPLQAPPAQGLKTTRPAPSPPLTKKGGYAIQLAAVREPESAQKLRARYARQGYRPYIEPQKIPGKGTLYRVRLGPYATLGEAKAAARELTEKFNQKCIIVPLKGTGG